MLEDEVHAGTSGGWSDERHVAQGARAPALPDLADRAAGALAAAADGRLRRPPLHSGADRHRGAVLAARLPTASCSCTPA